MRSSKSACGEKRRGVARAEDGKGFFLHINYTRPDALLALALQWRLSYRAYSISAIALLPLERVGARADLGDGGILPEGDLREKGA